MPDAEMAASSRRRSRFHEVVHVTPKTSDALEAAPQKKRQGSRSCGFWQEVANAVTMPFLLICMCIRSDAQPALPPLYVAAAFLQIICSVLFHVSLAAEVCGRLEPSWYSRLAIDCDMSGAHLVALASGYAMTQARGGMDSSFLMVLAVNISALAVIWSGRGKQGEALDKDLVAVRYPLVASSVLLEAGISFGQGAADPATWVAGLFAIVSILVLVDGRLGGWGHPLGHVVLSPGMYFRSQCLRIVLRSA